MKWSTCRDATNVESKENHAGNNQGNSCLSLLLGVDDNAVVMLMSRPMHAVVSRKLETGNGKMRRRSSVGIETSTRLQPRRTVVNGNNYFPLPPWDPWPPLPLGMG